MHCRKDRCRAGAWVMCRPWPPSNSLKTQRYGTYGIRCVMTPNFLGFKVRHVSPSSTAQPTQNSDDGRLSMKERRFALEQEVAKLRKIFSQEEKLHKILKRALQRPVGSLPRLPQSVPTKIQILLAEVAILEEEVIRLEDHVDYLRREISHETFLILSKVSHMQKPKPVTEQYSTKPSHRSRIRGPRDPSRKEPASRDSAHANPTKEPLNSSASLRKARKVERKVGKETHQQRPIRRERSKVPVVVAVAPSLGRGSTAAASADDGIRRRAGFSASRSSSSSKAGFSAFGSSSSSKAAITEGDLGSGLPPPRKPPGVGDVLARLEGWQQQQQQKSPQPSRSGGGSGRSQNNSYKQHSSLNWGQARFYHALINGTHMTLF